MPLVTGVSAPLPRELGVNCACPGDDVMGDGDDVPLATDENQSWS